MLLEGNANQLGYPGTCSSITFLVILSRLGFAFPRRFYFFQFLMARKQPNIVVTGTPGVGKTSHCEQLSQSTSLRYLSINEIVKDRGCHDGWDAEFKSWIVDEDRVCCSSRLLEALLIRVCTKLLDSIEDEMKQGGIIVDWHACDLFPESWIDLVVVLRTSTAKLYDRLKARHYPQQKLQENLDAEIMEVLLQEAREAFDEKIVVELQSDEAEDVDGNVERIEEWIKQWRLNRADDQGNG